MATIVGESAFPVNTPYTQSFEINMPADRVLAKVCLSYVGLPVGVAEFGAQWGVFIDLIKIKRPDGQIEEINVHTNAISADALTYIRYFILNEHRPVERPPLVWVLVTLEYWG